MYVWNHYGDVVVAGTTVVGAVVRLNVHGTSFIIGVVFALKTFVVTCLVSM